MEETNKKRKKFGGRKKGTPNKKTLILQEHLDTLDLDPILGLRDCLKELERIDTFEPDQEISLVNAKSKIYMELLQYIYPKRKAIEVQGTLDTRNKTQVIEIQWADQDDSQNETADAAAKADQPVN